MAPRREHMPTIWLICEANAVAADFTSISHLHRKAAFRLTFTAYSSACVIFSRHEVADG
jgi:hypothetical protein